jgi:acetyltransferase
MQSPDIRIDFDLRGTTVTIRTMTAVDRDIESEFVRNLSEESRYYRFHSALKELTPELLDRFTNVKYPENMALIATTRADGKEKQIAVARYAKYPDRDAAEVAVVVADAWQGFGLGRRMLIEIRNIAIAAGLRKLHMSVLAGNQRMTNLAHELGYHTEPTMDDHTTRQLGKPISPKTPNA